MHAPHPTHVCAPTRALPPPIHMQPVCTLPLHACMAPRVCAIPRACVALTQRKLAGGGHASMCGRAEVGRWLTCMPTLACMPYVHGPRNSCSIQHFHLPVDNLWTSAQLDEASSSLFPIPYTQFYKMSLLPIQPFKKKTSLTSHFTLFVGN